MLSRDAARARAFGSKVGVADDALCTDDFAAFASAIDVAYIATPHTDHCQDALRCLRAGLHVLVEKPMALTKADGESVAPTGCRRTAWRAALLCKMQVLQVYLGAL